MRRGHGFRSAIADRSWIGPGERRSACDVLESKAVHHHSVRPEIERALERTRVICALRCAVLSISS